LGVTWVLDTVIQFSSGALAFVCGDLSLNEIDFPLPVRSKPILVASDAEAFSRLFREGETITGKVIGRIDARRVVLRLQGHNLLVETTVPLAEQEERMFQIEATSPRVILRLLPEPAGNSSPADWLKKVIPHNVPYEKLLDNLSGFWKTNPEAFPLALRETVRSFVEFLRSFSLKDISDNPDSLRKAVTESGLFFEHKIKQWIEEGLHKPAASLLKGDLKGHLLKLKSELHSPPASPGFENSSGQAGEGSGIEQLGKGLDQLIQKLELTQLLNAVQPDPQEKIFLFLPLWFKDQPHFLDVNISLPRRGSRDRDEENCTILFLLHLPRWGEVRIEVLLRGKGLTCRFRVADPEVSKFVEPLLSDLKTRLDSLGFQSSLHLSLEPSKDPLGDPLGNPFDQVASSLISELRENVSSLVSIVV